MEGMIQSLGRKNIKENDKMLEKHKWKEKGKMHMKQRRTEVQDIQEAEENKRTRRI